VFLREVTDSNGVVSVESSFIDARAFLNDINSSSDTQEVLVDFAGDYTDTQQLSSFEETFLSVNINDYINGIDFNDALIIFKQVPGSAVFANQSPVSAVFAKQLPGSKVVANQDLSRIVAKQDLPRKVSVSAEGNKRVVVKDISTLV
jgi:hypothetical protein